MIQNTQSTYKILFADTDAGGMMYFGQASRWVEASINDWFQQNDYSFLDQKNLNLFWVVREFRTLYSQPISYNQTIRVLCRLNKIQRFSLTFEIKVVDESKQKKFVSIVRLVTTDKTSKETIPIPDALYVHKSKITNAS